MTIKNEKMVKVYFCPKCRSKDVGFIFSWKNAFGILPKMMCDKCKFESSVFPILVVNEEKLKKQNKKVKGRKK